MARQHNGRLGKEDNCQVGVFLIGVTPAGSALLDHQLFLPESWCEPTRQAKDRRAQAHIPEDSSFRTKPRIAADLIRNVAVLGTVKLDWVVADEEYGRAGCRPGRHLWLRFARRPARPWCRPGRHPACDREP